MADVYNSLVH